MSILVISNTQHMDILGEVVERWKGENLDKVKPPPKKKIVPNTVLGHEMSQHLNTVWNKYSAPVS